MTGLLAAVALGVAYLALYWWLEASNARMERDLAVRDAELAKELVAVERKVVDDVIRLLEKPPKEPWES